VRARLFLIVDDHSRLLADGRFYGQENARACQELLRRAITRRGLRECQKFCAGGGRQERFRRPQGVAVTMGRSR
jgi:hypothetical protein